MQLGFGGPRADRAPGNEVGQIQRRQDVEILDAGRNAHVVELQQQLAADAQTLVDVVAVVEVRVVDQPFPADRGARFFKIDAHDDQQMLVELRTQGFEAGRVFERRFRIVDRAWTDDHQQAIVATVEYVLNFAARVEGGLRRVVAGGQFSLYFGRRGNRTDRIDAGIFGDGTHDAKPCCEA